MSTTSRPAARPLLPQTTTSEFQFASPESGLGYSKKNYVFVDEHNRHKRLKVMRACEGCRRRKIKCDAATTNSWPCAACVRLKLQCIPPTVNYARSTTSDASGTGLERVLDFDSSDASGDEGYMPQPPMTSYSMSHPMGFSGSSPTYPSMNHRPSLQHMRHRSTTSVPLSAGEANFHGMNAYRSIPSSHPMQLPQRQETWPPAEPQATSISEALGELQIDEAGVAPYIFHQKQKLAEAPALVEEEINLSVRPGATVRIPDALMPNDLLCNEYFEIFFREIHPYIPVISKTYFYSQWSDNRNSISPLLLEAIFACAGRLSDSDPASGNSWLALASKHEQCFMDVPRLSTLQAIIILMKARENAPKRGYFYRSWMTVKTLVEMGKDLELDQHYMQHRAGHPCDSSDPTECFVKTRIWQSIFMIEQMIAGPQARYDMSVDLETVDFNIPQPHQAISRDEYQVSYNFTYMIRVLRNVRYLTQAYAPIRKKKNWGADPALAALNPELPKWLDDLPNGMQIHYPEDGAEPWLPDHYTGNLHCYYHLGLILLRRPQLMAVSNFVATGEWRSHMDTCYDSAKKICRLQESLLSNFGMNGLVSMTRGLNFAVYCILSSMMVHLVALTSPEPHYNHDAEDYFTRHMRLLEKCMTASPMKEMQDQIQSLREAFSVDTSKPFELRPDIVNQSRMVLQQTLSGSPAHSPVEAHRGGMAPQLRLQISQAQQQQILATHSLPVTPISNGTEDLKDGPMTAASLSMMAASAHPHQGQVPQHQHQLLSPQEAIEVQHQHNGGVPASYDAITTPGAEDGVLWNPTPIFDQWQAAFGTPASSISNTYNNPNGVPTDQQSPTMYSRTGSSGGPEQEDPQAAYNAHMGPPSNPSPGVATQQQFGGPENPHFVSPNMWQETVAATYAPNPLKRGWDE